MNVNDLKTEMKSLEKFFVDMEGEIHVVDDASENLHEKLAREICQRHEWNWREGGRFSAEDYLLEKGFVKFSNYSSLRYVAVSKKFGRDKEVMDRAYLLADLFSLKIEMY